MKVWDDEVILKESRNLCVALGTFDGVHLAHQELLRSCVDQAKELGYESIVYTFCNHPSEIYCEDDPTEVLTTAKEKLELFEGLGIDHVINKYFDEAFAQTSPEEFVRSLVSEGGKRDLFCGFDYHFGKDGEGDVALLEEMKDELGYELFVLPAMRAGDEVISSTVIRDAIYKADLAKAEALLGRPYGGTVKDFGREHSDGVSRSIYGLMENKIAPKAGDYRISVSFDDKILEMDAGVYGRNVTILDPEGRIPYEQKKYYVVYLERYD